MNFLHRFKFFAFGTGLGCLIVYGLLIRDRDFPAWLPEDRVLEELAVDSVIIGSSIQLQFADSLLVEHIMNSDVLFNATWNAENTNCNLRRSECGSESATSRLNFTNTNRSK